LKLRSVLTGAGGAIAGEKNVFRFAALFSWSPRRPMVASSFLLNVRVPRP
jgi:hypothetical protein